ncbi:MULTISPECIES: hypothetical protein [unclassified Microbacterium]|uniref:hypothetical protein n=1 Tax=unclassified Microbacterium TaxID=2609290 RepID=UPI000CFC0326|nr:MULTISPECIES: hypothetical protein [unclassified Microbacterium]PQZ59193.1 hypothetical protein CQ032_06410 [Microbacterium sp. MYb43]PQZ81285.1 hypothetical protein CQ031_06020 [Microbacterium sp. MYb40]PRB21711.1 hypothetical protein CQ040_07175 [Microbacterium sp. MYb54]PRB31470.1 hypothetical protein CQ037_01995 [Microbacterium sp. MYb50]PRB68348.1 hypothetical protein CQ021_06180 [Microbacterium sp. MYb24]
MSTPTITETTSPPRTRWGAIIWGLLFAAIAATALWMLADDDRRDAVADGLVALTPTTIVTILLLTVGVLLLVGGAAGLIRRAQRKLAATTSAPGPEIPDPLAE